MDVQEFQKILGEIRDIALKNGRILSGAQVVEFFSGMKLEKAQMLKVLQYLKAQGITIEGLSQQQSEEGKDAEVRERAPLTPEEKAYFAEYKAGLQGCCEDGASAEMLFERLSQGDSSAKAGLTAMYLPVAAEMAVEYHCGEIFLADLIQEANVSLLSALELPEPPVKDDTWLRAEMRRGVMQAIEEQTQRRFEDDCLVARVEKLESAIRELTEDEEDGTGKFSIAELAVILDMDIEEMQDVLRLTGEES